MLPSLKNGYSPTSDVPVAQLDRASDYGSEGREFESSRARETEMASTVM